MTCEWCWKEFEQRHKTQRFCSRQCAGCGTALYRKRRTPDDRFWEKVSFGEASESPLHLGPCWIWVATVGENGYGQFMHEDGHLVKAHRWSFTHLIGEVPVGLDLDHLCKNRACVHPLHLEPVTRSVNNLRGGLSKPHCPKGHFYDIENTGYQKNGNRYCKACSRNWAKDYYYRKRQERLDQTYFPLSLQSKS